MEFKIVGRYYPVTLKGHNFAKQNSFLKDSVTKITGNIKIKLTSSFPDCRLATETLKEGVKYVQI